MRQLAQVPDIPELGLMDITATEPDPTLFYPPKGYRIVREGDAAP